MAEEIISPQVESTESISDEEAILKIAQAMKDNAPTPDEKQNVHTFLTAVIQADEPSKIIKVGNLRDDKDMNELGLPTYHVRGDKDMALISSKIMNNDYFSTYFELESQNTLATSLSRMGFLVRQATVQTKQISDATVRKKTNKGWFGKKSEETSGGDITTQ